MKGQAMKSNRLLSGIMALVLLGGSVLFTACAQQEKSIIPDNENLSKGLSRSKDLTEYDFTKAVTQPEQYADFSAAVKDLSVDMLRETSGGQTDNTVVSPLSAAMLLGMSGNGAGGKTATELKMLLGDGRLSTDQLNACFRYIDARLTAFNNDSACVNIGNSMWVNKDTELKRTFLQKTLDYYNAAVYSIDFSAADTAKKINSFMSDSTNNSIAALNEDIDASAQMYLINAVYASAAWSVPYTSGQITHDNFITAEGEKVTASYMSANETYFSTDKAKGIIKNIDTLPCKFVAILPNEDITAESYLKTITGDDFSKLIENSSVSDRATALLPQFKIDRSIKLNNTLESLGLKTALNESADFGNMTGSDVYINDVMQDSFIEVGPEGIMSGAAATGEAAESVSAGETQISFNRPFIFAVVDNESNVPLFMGIVNDPTK